MSQNLPVGAPRLITIGFSHFGEKARWAMDLSKEPYTEYVVSPLLARLTTVPLGGTTVPMLVGEGLLLKDSTDILNWVAERHPGLLYPESQAERKEVAELEELFDARLGAHTRRIIFHHILPLKKHVHTFATYKVPDWQRWIFPLLAPFGPALMRRTLNINEASVARSWEKVQGVVAEINARLADGRRYLVGGRFTMADLSFAALMAPLVMPSEYPAPWPPMDDLPAEFVRLVESCRATPAGQFALRLYREDRGRLPPG